MNEGGTVNFDGTASTDTDGTIISYGWDFGDGNTGAGDTVSHTYADGSSFEVVLTVTDDGGATGTDTLTITVNNLDPAVEAGDNQTVKSGDTVTVAATFTDAGTLDTHTATINWGDTTTDSGTVTQGAGSGTVGGSHVYDSIGDMTVTVTVTDDDGGVGSDTLTVTVQAAVNEDPVAAAGDDQTVNEGETALFDGTTSSDPDGTIAKFEWDFGDGETAEGATQTHVYADEGTGTFTVTLTVTDDLGATASDTLDVTVNNVAPEVTARADQDAKEGDTVRISASFVEVGSEDTHTATIAWGDGTITELANVGSPLTASFVYGDDDKFTVSITITDNDGGENTDSLEVDIDNVAPIVVPGPDQSAFVNANVSIGAEFTDRGTLDTHTATIDWNEGTVEPGAVTEASGSGSVAGAHPYGNADTFEVLVTVRDDEDEEGEATLEVVTVAAGDLPPGIAVSGLNLSANVVNAGQPVTATFRIENTTDNRNTGEVRVFVRGDEEGTIAFDLLGRATKTVSLSIVKGVAGVFPVVVGDNLAEFRIEKARLEISNLSVAPRGPGPGSVVEISADARNAGGEPGTFTVSITANGSSAEGQLRLPPGASRPVVRFIPIPNVLPASGIEAEGFHTVTVDGESDFYEVKGAVVNTAVPTSYGFDPAKTSSTAADGTPLVLVPGGTSKLGGGSITLSIPVAAAGVRVGSFVDLTSGFRIIDTDVEIPIRDPNTGETHLTLIGELEEQLQGTDGADAATATFKFLDMIVDEQREDLSADDPIVGRLGVAVKARLSRLPDGLNVQEFIKKQLKDSDRVAVESVTRADGKIVANEAGTVTVKAPALGVGDVTEVEMTIKVSAKWVETYGEIQDGAVSNLRIARVDEQQNVEIIVPQCTGPDANDEYTCVGVTQGGFSEFSLLALVDIPTEFETRNLVVSPKSVAPGEAVKITADIVNTSTKAGSFTAFLKIQRPGTTEFEPIAVEGITLEGGEEGRVSFFVSREEQGTYQVDVQGLGDTFDVFRKIDAAQLRFSGLVITPAEVRPGEPATVSMFVENLGDEAGRTEIEFRINGVLTELRSVSVPGRERVSVTFEFTPPAEGTYTVELIDPEELVAPQRGEITAIEPAEPAEFVFAVLNVTPLEVGPGEEVTVTVQVSNIGGQAGVRTVVLLLDGVEVASQVVSVDELSAVPVTFKIDAPEEAGVYTVTIETLTGTFKVVVAPPLAAPAEPVIVSVTPVPGEVAIGELITIVVELLNDRDLESLPRTLVLKVDGVVIEERTVTLGPRERRTETFTFSAPDVVGRHELEIAGFTRSFEVKRVVVAAVLNLIPPLTITPSEVKTGQPVTIKLSLRNSGEEDGETEVILTIRGQEVERKIALVPGLKDVTVTFQFVPQETGDYPVEVLAVEARDVRVLEGSFKAVAPPVEEEEEEPPSPAKTSRGPGYPESRAGEDEQRRAGDDLRGRYQRRWSCRHAFGSPLRQRQRDRQEDGNAGSGQD